METDVGEMRGDGEKEEHDGEKEEHDGEKEEGDQEKEERNGEKDGTSLATSSFWTDGGGRKYLENMQAKPRRIPLRLGTCKAVRRTCNAVACRNYSPLLPEKKTHYNYEKKIIHLK